MSVVIDRATFGAWTTARWTPEIGMTTDCGVAAVDGGVGSHLELSSRSGVLVLMNIIMAIGAGMKTRTNWPRHRTVS